MNSLDIKKIEEAITIASEIPTLQRQAWLDEFCDGDDELKAEIESLLAFEDKAENFLEVSLAKHTAQILPERESKLFGKQFGHYKIIREIGRGGMGAVFLAERTDGEFEQQVALKIVRQTILDAESEKRFRSERQILASLNHPNIARLLDGGVSENGEPFLVMEYVEGESLTEFAQKRDLNVQERLKLFLKICSAVGYAHRNLIVHRDIKPGNILVTKEGEPKLLDFGLAKILDFDSDLTQTATAFRALTPAYASPEQLRGEKVTTASDIFSLGVVLYELLTETRPFDLKTNSFDEIVRSVSEVIPLKPSEVNNPQLKGDLDNIVMMALRKEPERRYKSVELFSADIERHLSGLPVAARPATFSYYAGKFIRRNWAISSVAALLLLSLIAGMIATIWQARVARAERDRAEKRFNDVRKLSTSLLFEISPQIERLPSSTQARETIVKRALEYLDSLAAEAGTTDESLQSELASAYEKVGDVQGKPEKSNLGDLQGATESYQKAQKIRLLLAEKYPADFETRRLLAANYYAIGDLRWWSSDVDGALENFRRAAEIYEKLNAEKPENLPTNLDWVNSQFAVAKVYSYNGMRSESMRILRQIFAYLKELKQASNPEILQLIGKCHILLAYDLSWEDRMMEADEETKKSLAILEPLAAANSNNLEIRRNLWLAYFLAGAIFEDANPSLSRQFLEKSIALAKENVQNDRLDFQSKHDLAQSYSKFGVISTNQEKYDEAIQFHRQAQTILDELTAAEPKHSGYKLNIANSYTRIGEALEGKRDFENALKNYEKAVALQEEMRRNDPADNMPIRAIAVSSQSLARVYEQLKQCDKAVALNRRGLEMFSLLRQRNAFSDYDKKTVDDLQKAIERCQ